MHIEGAILLDKLSRWIALNLSHMMDQPKKKLDDEIERYSAALLYLEMMLLL